MSARIHLLVIDPQNDFIDIPGRPGSLAVTGAFKDMQRLAAFIDRTGAKLDDIHVTLDSHRIMDIAHPTWWSNPNSGDHPAPFTIITPDDVGYDRKWVPTVRSEMDTMKLYVDQLYKNKRYPLCIWPEHCLIGTWGHNIQNDVMSSLMRWERENIAFVDYVTKGSNPKTEHYSAVQAEIPDENDPSTQLNTTLIKMLSGCDQIVIAGEARSHCVANTVRDIANNFGEENVKKMVLLNDCTSDVLAPGIEHFGKDFVAEMQGRGMKISTSVDYLA